MKVSNKKSAIAAGLVTTFLSLATGMAGAQQQNESVKFPADLQWHWMSLVVFNFPGFHEGTVDERKFAESIWKKSIESAPMDTIRNDGSRLPSFILFKTVEDKDLRFTFTTFSSASANCEKAPNGPFVNKNYVPPMYNLCPMRVIVEEKSTGRRKQKDFPNYCHLFVDDPDAPIQKNHIEVAYDAKTGSAYFRAIQYGKQAPECDRALHLK